MVITYDKYIGLMSALDEHCNGILEKKELQDAIFDHYISKYGNFVAENINGEKRLFTSKLRKTKSYRVERKVFRNFMNKELSVKHLKKLKSCQK